MNSIMPNDPDKDPDKHQIVFAAGKLQLELKGWIAVMGCVLVCVVAVANFGQIPLEWWSAIHKLVLGA